MINENKKHRFIFQKKCIKIQTYKDTKNLIKTMLKNHKNDNTNMK